MGAGIALKPDELADFQQQFDAVIELTGKVEAVETAINLCHYDGRIVVGSWFGEDGHTLTLNTHFHRSRIQIISSQVSTIHPALRGRFNSQRRLDLALNHLKRLKPSRLISHRFAFSREQITEAYHLLDHPSPLHLQMVFTYRHR
jgi:threonine dehydrogenase-like Zn-dependent dehydrogenase